MHTIYIVLIITLISSCSIKKQKKEKDWIEIYQQEIIQALLNDDEWAYYFFTTELAAERKRLQNIKKDSK